jgi:hypothetical protein
VPAVRLWELSRSEAPSNSPRGFPTACGGAACVGQHISCYLTRLPLSTTICYGASTVNISTAARHATTNATHQHDPGATPWRTSEPRRQQLALRLTPVRASPQPSALASELEPQHPLDGASTSPRAHGAPPVSQLRAARILVIGRDGGRGAFSISFVHAHQARVVGSYRMSLGTLLSFDIRTEHGGFRDMVTGRTASTAESLLPSIVREAPWSVDPQPSQHASLHSC